MNRRSLICAKLHLKTASGSKKVREKVAKTFASSTFAL